MVLFRDDGLPVDSVDVAEVRILLNLDPTSQDVSQAGQADLLHSFHLSYHEGKVLQIIDRRVWLNTALFILKLSKAFLRMSMPKHFNQYEFVWLLI